MTNEEIRIKVAEACGWTEIVHHKLHAGNEGLLGTHIAADGVRDRDWVPDYLNDLNAMHEAETSLTDEHWDDYAAHLGLWDDDPYRAAKALHATARQRCIAYLKTKGIIP